MTTHNEFEKTLEEACKGLERCDRELAAAFALSPRSPPSPAAYAPVDFNQCACAGTEQAGRI